ncbi:MAG TPA: hypothetical protein PKY88_02480 [Anaerohalosphaeraceae bacterium]|nr:hypothetical protein [Anaerohalosphaeraceae bacterium]
MDRKKRRRFLQEKAGQSPMIALFERTVLALMLFAAAVGWMMPKVARAAAENRITLLMERLHQVRSGIALYRAQNDGRLPGRGADGRVTAETFCNELAKQGCQIPANPFVQGPAGRQVTVADDAAVRPTGREGTGWWYNAATGHFAACDSRYHSAY